MFERKLFFIAVLSALSVLAIVPIGRAQLNEKPLTVEITARDRARDFGIISFRLPTNWKDVKNVQMQLVGKAKSIAVQVRKTPEPQIVWMLEKPIKKGESRRYRVSAVPPLKSQPHRVACIQDDKGLTVRARGKSVLRYNTAVLPCPVPNNASCRRSGFIHPLFNPDGQIVTDDFPPDHPHQHGIMFPWTNTTFEGRKVDFWNQNGKTGTVEHVKVLHKASGPVFAEFTAKLRHLDLKAPGGPKPALDETWTVRVYNPGGFFVFDMKSVQRCATKSPLRINEYHYGAMAIRGCRQWFVKGACDFLTSDGKTRTSGNHTRPRWVDMHGTIDGKKSGVAILCHPRNFRSPQPVRLHPSKPYFCWAPQVLGGFTISPGKDYVSRYRIVVHMGLPHHAFLDGVWRDYAEPLRARVVQD